MYLMWLIYLSLTFVYATFADDSVVEDEKGNIQMERIREMHK